MAREARAQKIAALRAERLQVEQADEALIRSARAEGRIIACRPDADPAAVLMVQVRGAGMSARPFRTTKSSIVRTECRKAVWQHGFCLNRGEAAGWAVFASTTALGTLQLAAGGPRGLWYLALDHRGVIAEFVLAPAPLPGPDHVPDSRC